MVINPAQRQHAFVSPSKTHSQPVTCSAQLEPRWQKESLINEKIKSTSAVGQEDITLHAEVYTHTVYTHSYSELSFGEQAGTVVTHCSRPKTSCKITLLKHHQTPGLEPRPPFLWPTPQGPFRPMRSWWPLEAAHQPKRGYKRVGRAGPQGQVMKCQGGCGHN